MFEKSCKCGASKKNFKFDIGEFFIGECCEAAGYDEHGNRKDLKPLDPATTSLLEDTQNSTEATNLEINDEGEQPEPVVTETDDAQDPEEDDQSEPIEVGFTIDDAGLVIPNTDASPETVEAPESAPAAPESKTSKKNKNKDKNK